MKRSAFRQKLLEIKENMHCQFADFFEVILEANAMTNSIASVATLRSEWERLKTKILSILKS